MRIEDKGTGSTASEVSLGQAKFELEKWKAEEEVKLRRGELELKQKEASKSVWSSPLLLGVIGLLATILASIIQNSYQTYANRELERQKFQSTLILKALETDDQLTAARRFKRYLDLALIQDQNKKIASYVNDPGSIPLDPPSEVYVGDERKAAKLSVGSGKMEVFNDLADLIASLPTREAMPAHSPPITTDAASGRVGEEQRNVHLRAFLYAASREADNDFHLILGRAPNSEPATYMTAEVSGLPPKDSPDYVVLSAARNAYEQFLADKQPGAGYDYYEPPIPVQIEGSLFFDARYATGPKAGPPSLKSHMPTVWEVHPVTSIKLGP